MGIPAPTLRGRAVVTGASRGIGEALATELAARGHNLIITARHGEVLDELAARLSSRYSVTVEVRRADLLDPVQRGRLADELAGREISILCANAGGTSAVAPVAWRDPASMRAEAQLNMLGMHDLALAVLPGMLRRRAGGILVSGSAAGNSPIPNCTTYSASKAFVNTFAESLHGELKGSGVHVTVLAPGLVRGPLSSIPGWMWTTAEHCAPLALDGLVRNRMRVVPGLHAKAITVLNGYAPRMITTSVWNRLTAPRARRAALEPNHRDERAAHTDNL